MTEAVLEIGGRRLAGWTSVSVVASVENLAPMFRLNMSERSPGVDTPRRVKPGDAAVVELDGEVVVIGHVDRVAPAYDADSHSIAVAGRDATGDLVDCSAVPGPSEWHNETLAGVAEGLCAPFGISVSGAPTDTRFRKFTVEMGETVFEALDRACRMRGVLPRADGRGGLVLGPVATGRAKVGLERGKNILSATATLSGEGRFSSYKVLGQQPGSEFLSPEAAAHVSADAQDRGVRRFRPRVVVAEQPLSADEAIERVRWERDVRNARSRRADVTVRGWRERGDDGALWRQGVLVHVTDDWLGLDATMLIATVNWRRDDTGTTTKLALMHERAFVRPIETGADEEEERDFDPWERAWAQEIEGRSGPR